MLSRAVSRQAWCITARVIPRSTAISTSKSIRAAQPRGPTTSFPRSFSTSYKRLVSVPMASETDAQAEEVQSTTGITPDSLSETLKSSTELNASHVDIQDISG